MFSRSPPFAEKNALRLLSSPVYASFRSAVLHRTNRQTSFRLLATDNVSLIARLNLADSALTQVLIPREINSHRIRTHKKSRGWPSQSVNQPTRAKAATSNPPRRDQPFKLSLFFLPVVSRSAVFPQEML